MSFYNGIIYYVSQTTLTVSTYYLQFFKQRSLFEMEILVGFFNKLSVKQVYVRKTSSRVFSGRFYTNFSTIDIMTKMITKCNFLQCTSQCYEKWNPEHSTCRRRYDLRVLDIVSIRVFFKYLVTKKIFFIHAIHTLLNDSHKTRVSIFQDPQDFITLNTWTRYILPFH